MANIYCSYDISIIPMINKNDTSTLEKAKNISLELQKKY